MKLTLLVLAVVIFLPVSNAPQLPAQKQLTVTAVNRLKLARRQTIELTAKDLASLAEKDLTNVHVLDSAGKEVLNQSVDTDYDDYHRPDILIFQADFAPGETKTSLLNDCVRRSKSQ